MKYAVDKQEKYSIFKLNEEKLDSLIAPTLKSEFVTAFSQGARNLIFDLSDVKFVDSSGLSAILAGNRLWSSNNASFVLTGVVHASVKRLIEISRLNTVLTIIPTVEESVEYIFMEEIERELKENGGEE